MLFEVMQWFWISVKIPPSKPCDTVTLGLWAKKCDTVHAERILVNM